MPHLLAAWFASVTQPPRSRQFVELDLLADPDDPRDLYGIPLRAGEPAAKTG